MTSTLSRTLLATAFAAAASAQIQTVDFTLQGPTNGIEDVAVADIEGDGDQDLICAYRVGPAATAASVVTVVYNDGTATPFASPVTSTMTIVGSNATRIQIRVGNVIGTPIPDIVVFSRNAAAVFGAIRVFAVLSSPSGLPNTFTAAGAIAAPPLAGFDDFVLGDLDFDGDADLIAVVPGTSAVNPDQVQAFDNGGTLPFAPFALSPQALPTVSSAQRMRIAVGAIDAFSASPPDDLLVRAGPPGAEQIHVLLGTGMLGPTLYSAFAANVFAASGAQGVDLADFNADGLADGEVYFAGVNAHSLAVPGIPSYGGLTVSANAGGAGGIVATGDLEPDGDNDAVSGDAAGNVCFHINDGAGNFNVGFTGPFTVPAGAPVQALVLGDVGAMSGAPDLVVATTSPILQIWVQ